MTWTVNQPSAGSFSQGKEHCQSAADKSTQDAAGTVKLASKYTLGLTGRIFGGLLVTWTYKQRGLNLHNKKSSEASRHQHWNWEASSLPPTSKNRRHSLEPCDSCWRTVRQRRLSSDQDFLTQHWACRHMFSWKLSKQHPTCPAASNNGSGAKLKAYHGLSDASERW